VGDFTLLRVLVIEAGISSHPFDLGPGVFDPAAHAAQRAFTEIETGSTQRCRLGTTKCEGLTRRR
jgi:hypothetical protein